MLIGDGHLPTYEPTLVPLGCRVYTFGSLPGQSPIPLQILKNQIWIGYRKTYVRDDDPVAYWDIFKGEFAFGVALRFAPVLCSWPGLLERLIQIED